MQKFKEFQGKDLDECIQQACSFYDLPREKLEIEIVQDAKSGIFGIVGARKAKIRARRANLADAVQSILGGSEGKEDSRRPRSDGQHEANRVRNGDGVDKDEKPVDATAGSESQTEKHAAKDNRNNGRSHGEHGRKAPREQPEKKPHSLHAHAEKAPDFTDSSELAADDLEDAGVLCMRPLEEVDREKLENVTREVVEKLVKPVAGREVVISVTPGDGRLRVKVEWQGDAGLLIGREGQTLAAIQYLASRIISKAVNAIVRVQLDIGEYRSRQDDKLRELAFSLAEKARETGRSCSTRPLSSYHRRIIHLSLQDESDVQTRSSGTGPMKRVIIAPKRNAGN